MDSPYAAGTGMNSMRIRLVALTIALPLLAACGSAAGATSQATPTSAPTPSASASAAPGSVQRGVVYCTNAGVALTMDIYRPSQVGEAPTPAVLYVHGGGWEHGSSTLGGINASISQMLTQRGLLVAAVNYRLAPQDLWPAPVADGQRALRLHAAHPQP